MKGPNKIILTMEDLTFINTQSNKRVRDPQKGRGWGPWGVGKEAVRLPLPPLLPSRGRWVPGGDVTTWGGWGAPEGWGASL